MRISDAGLDLIKSFEGYHDALPDGSCRAYLDKLAKPNIWTIGWGCTVGIKPGMVWTKQQAEDALRAEVSKKEPHVERLVTVTLNQNEFDALVSFAYNCGEDALAKSSILKRLNAGDRRGAASAFKLWNKAGGKVRPGLVNRRAREATLFLTPVEPSPVPAMPQTVEASSAIAPIARQAALPVTLGVMSGLTVPAAPDLGAYTSWQGAGETIKSLGAFAWSNPGVTLLLGTFILVLTLIPKILPEKNA